MKKIKINVSTSKLGSAVSKIIEVEDELDDEEIAEVVWENAVQLINYDWEEIK